MEYIKIRFGNDMDPLGCSFRRTVDEIFRPRPVSPMFLSSERTWSPQMDIYETPEEIIVLGEIAGVDKDDLEVEINSKAVRISGSRRELPKTGNATFRLAEIQYGPFERILFLPAPIDTEVVSSSYSNGFLQLRLAKQSSNVSHKIPISDE